VADRKEWKTFSAGTIVKQLAAIMAVLVLITIILVLFL
jgi:hypothetical protein